MKCVVSLLVVLLSVSLVSAQEAGGEDQTQGKRRTAMPVKEYAAVLRAQLERLEKEWGESPSSLTGAHVKLEQILSPETLAEIDAMDSEGDMIGYHHGLGMSMRNAWGLWADSRLAKHMQELGFTDGDEISGVILETFWCKRHGEDFQLAERAAEYRNSEQEKENRIAEARAAMRTSMMGLHFEKRDIPMVPIALRNSGVRTRFLCPFRDGVFLTGYHRGSLPRGRLIMQEFHRDPNGDARPTAEYDDFVFRGYCIDPIDRNARRMKPGEDFYTQGYYLDPADRKIHRIRVPEVDEVYSAVVAGGRAWFAGLTDGKFVVTGVGDHDRIALPLPEGEEVPDLGLDGSSLLAVYMKTIYRLVDRQWSVVHSGDILLPRSGLPPQRDGNTVFLREEDNAMYGSYRRLWWLTMGQPLHLSVLEHDVGVLAAGPLRWDNVISYCMTSSGDLWACVDSGVRDNWLFRRSTDGRYSIAVLLGSVRSGEDPPASGEAERHLHVSGVKALPGDTLLLVGNTGLYRLKGNELVQELAFASAGRDAKVMQRYDYWQPNDILSLHDGSYVVSSSRDGVYWLRQGGDGQWSCLPVEEGDPVVW